MTSNTPQFWYAPKSRISRFLTAILRPLAMIYSAGDKINQSFDVTNAVDIPVICVGNLNIGGAGKTPVCIALSKILVDDAGFLSPVFLTRGYGGNILGPEFVDTSNNAAIWGDEPLLLNKHARTVVSRNRYQGAKLASQSDADIVIMDDGLQNKTLEKTITLVVVDGTYGFGNQQTIPAGPLRRPLEQGLNAADAFIIMGEDNYGIKGLIPKDKPVFSAKTKVKAGWKVDKKKKYVSFCGIAHPAKFEASLKDRGLDIEKSLSFPDHHVFTDTDMEKLSSISEKLDAQLITTEKDYVRLPDSTFKSNVMTLPVEAHFTAKEKKALCTFIQKNINDKLPKEA